MVLFIYICNQWHRSGKHVQYHVVIIIALAYAKGYIIDPPNPYYMITEAIPGFITNWKFLSGAAFTIPISVVGIFMVLNA
jgi:hypothetical protein